MSPVIEESVVLPRVSRGKGVSVTGTLRGLPAAVAESPCPEAHSGFRMPGKCSVETHFAPRWGVRNDTEYDKPNSRARPSET